MIPQPRTPVFIYEFTTPARTVGNTVPGATSATWAPGVDPETRGLIAWTSFELTKSFNSINILKLTFEDPYGALIDDSRLRILETTINFTFGWHDEMSSPQQMLLGMTEQSFSETGHVQTTLTFGGQAIGFRYTFHDWTYQDPQGQKQLSIYDVAGQIAQRWSLNLVAPDVQPLKSSQRWQWKQIASNDLDFLRQNISDLVSSHGSDHFTVYVENNNLHVEPTHQNNGPTYVFTWKDPSSPLKSFTPQIPGMIVQAAAYAAAVGGIDGPSKQTFQQVLKGNEDPNQLLDNPGLIGGGKLNDPNSATGNTIKNTLTRRTPMKQHPELDGIRRTTLETDIMAYANALMTLRTQYAQQGKTPDQISALLADDFVIYNALIAWLAGKTLTSSQIDALITTGHYTAEQLGVSPPPLDGGTGTANSKTGGTNPNTPPMVQTGEAMLSDAVHAMLQGTAEFWGMPSIDIGQSVEFRMPSKMFSVTMWPWVIRHDINNQRGFVTSITEMHAYGTGQGDSAQSATTDTAATTGPSMKKRELHPLVEIWSQVDYADGGSSYSAVAIGSQRYLQQQQQQQGGTSQPKPNTISTAPIAYPNQ